MYYEMPEGDTIEVFYLDQDAIEREGGLYADAGFTSPGWYWWACLPGCLPDSEANGPFDNEAFALTDAGFEPRPGDIR